MSMNLSIHDVKSVTLDPVASSKYGAACQTITITDTHGVETEIYLFSYDKDALRVRQLDEDGTEVAA